MQKIIREVGNGIQQITFVDERWYAKEISDPVTGLPTFKYVPSVTWIAGHYPKGIAFYKYLASKGWDESEALKEAAGIRGSKVHSAISAILNGEEVRIDSKFMNPTTNQLEELTLEECDAILSFVRWREATKPKDIAWDVTVYSDEFNYAGSVDYICQIDGQYWVVDFKTSADVWPSYELQVSAYKHGLLEAGMHPSAEYKLAILQVGYRRNKAGWKWNEIEDQFDLFLAARMIWSKECEGEEPKKKDYPIVLSAARKKKEPIKKVRAKKQ